MGAENSDSNGIGRLVGRYANYFKLGHNAFEFIFDFGQFHLEDREPRFHTRVITSPVYAKALFDTLRESIDRYENEYGAIPQGENKEPTQDGG